MAEFEHANLASERLWSALSDHFTADEKARFISNFAHELAEKIREFQVTPSGNPTYDEGKDAGLDLAADLIDPEVKR